MRGSTEPVGAPDTPPAKDVRLGILMSGLASGFALALADALTTGTSHSQPAILVLGFYFGLLLGGACGIVAALVRKPTLAFALVFAVAATFNGSAIILERSVVIGRGAGVGLVLLMSLVAALVLVCQRAPGPGLGFALLASVPAGGLLVGRYASCSLAVAVACALPLLAVLAAWLVRNRIGEACGALLGLSAAVLLAFPPSPLGGRGGPPDVMLIVVDALRADAVPENGFFDRLAREGVVFESCVSAAPWTLPSVASILTSLLPTEHGAKSREHALPADVLTLAEAFRAGGYQTVAFSGGGFVGPAFGFDQGFDFFDATSEQRFDAYLDYVPMSWRLITSSFCPLPSPRGWVDEIEGVRSLHMAAERWAHRRDRRRPAFVLLHTYEVHDYFAYHQIPDDSLRSKTRLSEEMSGRRSVRPKELFEASQGDLNWFREVYEHRIPYTEKEIEHLVKAHARWSGRELIVALVSDHGEGFDAARGRVLHGGRLHEDLLHVPLILHWPEGLPAGKRVREPVSTLDIMPTLLELASIDAPPGLSGRSLIPLIHGELSGERSLWSENLSGESRGRSLRRGHWKVHDLPGGVQAFDISSDPSEDHVLSAPEALLEELRSFDGRFTVRAPELAVIDERSLEHLRELGYIE